jgi:hypothetical protein
MLEYASVISAIVEKRKALSPQRALLVGISGIASLDFVGIFLNPKSPLTHLNENRGFYDSRFQVCAAAASQGAGVHGSSRIDPLVGDWS